MEKWSIEPAPSRQDVQRRQLLIQGDMGDVMKIVKKFGAHCGRPRRIKPTEGFSFALYLNGMSSEKLDTMRALLVEMAPAPAAASPPEAAPISAPVPEIPPPTGVTAPATPEIPPPTEAAPPAASDIPAPADIPPLIPEVPQLVPEAAPPSSALPPEAIPPPPAELIPLTPEAVTKPSANDQPSPVEGLVSGFVPPEVPIEEILPSPPEVEAASAVEAAPARPMPVESAAAPPVDPGAFKTVLDPARNFDNILVGSFNRFAHAAATSVISSPGNMYNPLFIYGGPGVGKTHMLNAIGVGSGASLGADNVIFTTGARLSHAVESAVNAGRFGEIEAAIESSKAILVDDIHLMSVSEVNQSALARLFAHFFGKNLQVIFTSLYPAKALGSLEEALKISFGKGWSVDMKIPNQDIQMDMLTAGFLRWGSDFTKDEIALVREKMENNYSDSVLWMKRLLVLRNITDKSSTPLTFDKLLAKLFAIDVLVEGQNIATPAEIEAAKNFVPPMGGPPGPPTAVLVPKGREAMGPFMLSKFFEVNCEGEYPQGYRIALNQAYDCEQPFGVPFQIGKACHQAGVKAALVLGPPPTSDLAGRAGEFAHAVGHILESLDIDMAWIPFEGTLSPNNMHRAHLDLLPKPFLTETARAKKS